MHRISDCPAFLGRLGLVHAGMKLLAFILTKQGGVVPAVHAGMRAVPAIGVPVMETMVMMAVFLSCRAVGRGCHCRLRQRELG